MQILRINPATTLLLLLLTICCLFSATAVADTSPRASETGRYTYYGNDGIFVFYETRKIQEYRALLPARFDMPDRLIVQSFIMDYYKMDERTEPYKEAAVFLLAKYKGKDIWHCITMPVTTEESRILGIRRLGLPKSLGDIEFERHDTHYSGVAITDDRYKMFLSLDTNNYRPTRQERQLIRRFVELPRLNIKQGRVIEMTRSSRRNIMDVARRFPDRLKLDPGKAVIRFETPPGSEGKAQKPDPFHLTPTKVLAAYYFQNSFQFRLGIK